ncbi:uncharacterized protein LOC132754903 isoform X2 [Ruditapes philippinarum]|uniref:uncharacterized protein LOC132754903 isoform X2 n=1 Tax=Ruditapes philippinarum TaxID=129788 RepID=UPI00295AFD60|nr:uncharacterized protein LOC132754903 isoform X2 [Ruditapes philippinarum]
MSNWKYDVCYNSAMSDKARKVNWTTQERDMLISKCETADVATGKFSQTITAADKARFWADVVESVNSVSGCSRTLEQVKKKWIDLKSQTKKKTIQYIAETRKTGGGPAPILDLKAWESKILQTIPTCSVEGIENGADTFLALGRKEILQDKGFEGDNEPVPKKAKYDKKTEDDIYQLVEQQTAIMTELNSTLKTLNQSLDGIKNDKTNLFKILTRHVCFPYELRRTEIVCYNGHKINVDILNLDI